MGLYDIAGNEVVGISGGGDKKLGVTPIPIGSEGAYAIPSTPTRFYTTGGVKNLFPDFRSELTVGASDYSIVGNQLTVTSTDAPNLGGIVELIYDVLPAGEYTLYFAGEKDTDSLYIRWGTENTAWQGGFVAKTWSYIQVPDDGAKFKLRINAYNSKFPLTVKLYLYKGHYDSIPTSGESINVNAPAGKPFGLNAFRGQTVYSDPANVEVFMDEHKEYQRPGHLVCFGDSLTQESKYPERLTEMGMSATNLGVSGSRLIGSDAYSMRSIVDALKAGDMSAQISGGKNKNFASLLGLATAADGIVLEFGTNDYNQEVVIDGVGTDTIEGGMRYVLTELFKLYPAKMIYVISTFPQTWWKHESQPVNPNGTVRKMNETIHKVCQEFGVPWLDILDNYCNNDITKNAISNDGLHPNNEAGRNRYSKMIFGMLKALGR